MDKKGVIEYFGCKKMPVMSIRCCKPGLAFSAVFTVTVYTHFCKSFLDVITLPEPQNELNAHIIVSIDFYCPAQHSASVSFLPVVFFIRNQSVLLDVPHVLKMPEITINKNSEGYRMAISGEPGSILCFSW